jgi:hypothetical protein
MKNPSQIALTVIVTFVVTLGLNLLLGYISLDKGTVLIGPVVAGQNASYVAVDISNFTEEVISDLKLSIPAYVSIRELIASDLCKSAKLMMLSEPVNENRFQFQGSTTIK